ncbi:MAG: hypothetical protein ACRENS_00155 [Candidatus Eiseniibacteriota bacterium]
MKRRVCMPVGIHVAAVRAALALLALLASHTPAFASGSRHAPSAAPPPANAIAPDTEMTFPRFYDAMLAIAPDSACVAEVASVQLMRDAGLFVLEHGTLALCRPVAGVTCAAVFSGRGTFLCTPPPGPERDQLEHTQGKRVLRRDFQTLVLMFSDTTLSELRQIANFGPGPAPKSMRDALKEALPFLVNNAAHSVAPHLAKPLLDRVGDGFFLAVMPAAQGPLFFALDPQQAERVELLRQPDNDHYGAMVRHGLEIVSRFRASGDTLPDSSDTRPPVRVLHTSLSVSVGADLVLRITATLQLESVLDGQRWLPFQLPPGTAIESVGWPGGMSAPHWNWSASPVLWVRCDPPLAAGERRALRFVYRTHTLDRANQLISNHAPLGWYPRLDTQSRGTFDLTFQLPSHYQLAASGLNESTVTRDAVTTSRWTVDSPAPFALFEFGRFRRLDAQPDSLLRVSVLLVDEHHAGRSEKLNPAASAPRTPEQSLAAEIASEAQFFRHAFGPLPDRPVSAVQGAVDDATASPQLVRLPMIFADEPDADVPPLFYRAREMARQWWGVQTWPASSHDRWLCEGLANYSAAWYAQSMVPQPDDFFGLLDSWRRRLIAERDFLPDRATPASPLRAGARLDESPGSGTRVAGADERHLEPKAAWVIHMLRGLMLDPADPDEQRFGDLLRGFYAAHRGTAFTTADFRAAAEAASDRDLGWFFDQWVDHSAIPTYAFSYRVDRNRDGQYVVRGRVKQSKVPPSFRMDVPVRVETGAEAPARLRVQVQGAVTEFELPAMSEKPSRVVFNDLGAVLCEVVEGAWE